MPQATTEPELQLASVLKLMRCGVRGDRQDTPAGSQGWEVCKVRAKEHSELRRTNHLARETAALNPAVADGEDDNSDGAAAALKSAVADESKDSDDDDGNPVVTKSYLHFKESLSRCELGWSNQEPPGPGHC